jgi:hypothetical protein
MEPGGAPNSLRAIDIAQYSIYMISIYTRIEIKM